MPSMRIRGGFHPRSINPSTDVKSDLHSEFLSKKAKREQKRRRGRQTIKKDFCLFFSLSLSFFVPVSAFFAPLSLLGLRELHRPHIPVPVQQRDQRVPGLQFAEIKNLLFA